MRRVELSELSPSWFAVRADPVAVLVELGDARVDVPVADVDIALRIPGHVGGLAELAVDGRQRGIHPLPRFRIVRGFLLAAEHHRDAPFGIQADDHVRSLVHEPEVVVPVEANGVGVGERVETLADLADELAVLVELEELRRRRTERRARVAVGPREDDDAALRADGDARRLAQVHVGRKLQEVGHRVERDFRNRLLGERHRAHQQEPCD